METYTGICGLVLRLVLRQAVLEFIRDTKSGCSSAVMAGVGPSVEEAGDDSEEGNGSEGGEGKSGPLSCMFFPLSFSPRYFFCHSSLPLFLCYLSSCFSPFPLLPFPSLAPPFFVSGMLG